MKHPSDEFDPILDEALSVYRNAEPLAGLEGRVLQRLRLQHDRRRKLWLRWSTAAACACILVALALIGLHTRRQTSAAEKSQSTAPQPSASRTRQAPTNEESAESVRPNHELAVKRQRKTTSQALGRQSLPIIDSEIPATASGRMPFPSPAPLSRGERSLIGLGETHPEVLSETAKNEDLVVIAPIDIQPLSDSYTESRENQ